MIGYRMAIGNAQALQEEFQKAEDRLPIIV